MFRMFAILTCSVIGLSLADSTSAQSPVRARGTALTMADCELTPRAGGHLVYLQSFRGPDPNSEVYREGRKFLEEKFINDQRHAENLALEFAEYVRTEYKLPTYIFVKGREINQKDREHVDKVRKDFNEFMKQMQGVDPEIKPLVNTTMIKRERVAEEFGVFVGGSRPLADLEEASALLKQVKRWNAPPDKFTARVVRVRPDTEAKDGAVIDNHRPNPFMSALCVRNPTMPPEQRQAGDDPILKDLNDGNPYSLLKCPKPFTLAVKVYQGSSQIINAAPKAAAGQAEAPVQGKGITQLEAAAMNAENLAKMLSEFQKPKLEAYVLHTRYASYVCVGGYDSADPEKDPKLAAAITTLRGLSFTDNKPENKTFGQSIGGLMAQPRPMLVPKP